MTEFEVYMKTGILGSYRPERATLRQEKDGITAIYRDTIYNQQDDCMTGTRFMEVGGKCFRITSVFPEDSSSTATEKLLSYIDSTLAKGSRRA